MATMTKVTPAAPVAPWLGGKKNLSKAIIERIEATPHKTYAEPFVGMGGVFLRRSWMPVLEVANDLNGDITNLFRILQRHYPQFMEVMKFSLSSRRDFDRLAATNPDTLTDLERAARFLYLQRTAFGGKATGQSFGVAKDRPPRFRLSRMEVLLEAAHERLENVQIESLDWAELIARYDGKDTLFYLDPPYWGNEDDYGKDMFDPEQFSKMADVLSQIEGRFILSINDRPEIRDIFRDFLFEEVSLTYTVAAKEATKARELFIANYETNATLL